MKEQLISFETAILAKEKGFDKSVRYGVYGSKMKLTEYHGLRRNLHQRDVNWNAKTKQQKNSQSTSVPTQSLLQKWLREEHKVSIKIDDFYTDEKIRFDYNISDLGSQDDNPRGIYETYESALEASLQEALKLIKE